MIDIDSDFPGGNVRVDAIEGDLVRLQPDLDAFMAARAFGRDLATAVRRHLAAQST